MAAKVAQPLGCPTGSCVTGRWLVLQDTADGEWGCATHYLHPRVETLHGTWLTSDEATASLMV